MYTNRPAGFWWSHEKEQYNPDGSVSDAYRERLLSSGTTPEEIDRMENVMKRELLAYKEQVKIIEENYGMSYEEYRKRNR